MIETTIRQPEAEDIEFIIKSWSKSYLSQQVMSVPREWQDTAMRLIIMRLMINAKVHILCVEESPDVILGYIVGTPEWLGFVYVKFDYRRLGFGTKLMKTIYDFTEEIPLTHWTTAAKHLKDKWNLKKDHTIIKEI